MSIHLGVRIYVEEWEFKMVQQGGGLWWLSGEESAQADAGDIDSILVWGDPICRCTGQLSLARSY